LSFRDSIIAILVPVILGFGFVIAKPAFEYFPPFLLMGLRFSIAAFIMIWWFPIPKGLFKNLIIVSFIGSTLQYGLTYSGLNIIDASSAVLLVQVEVPFGVIVAYFLLKEKPGIKNLLGICVSFFGVYILTGAPNLEGKFFGVLLTLSGACTWAYGAVLAKPLSEKMNPFALTAWLCLFSGPLLILASAIFDGNIMNYVLSANLNSWLIVAYLGLIMQPLAYGCWYYVLKRNPVYKVLPVLMLLPLTGLLAAIFLLGEKPGEYVFIGGGIILIGVSMILFGKQKKI
jgi:O-acetylserine/cysteine efflux transporter|tara:strand:+ start:79 stop:936 length:858 start_codon:yes stop_codon:yes gene_type:complete